MSRRIEPTDHEVTQGRTTSLATLHHSCIGTSRNRKDVPRRLTLGGNVPSQEHMTFLWRLSYTASQSRKRHTARTSPLSPKHRRMSAFNLRPVLGAADTVLFTNTVSPISKSSSGLGNPGVALIKINRRLGAILLKLTKCKKPCDGRKTAAHWPTDRPTERLTQEGKIHRKIWQPAQCSNTDTAWTWTKVSVT